MDAAQESVSSYALTFIHAVTSPPPNHSSNSSYRTTHLPHSLVSNLITVSFSPLPPSLPPSRPPSPPPAYLLLSPCSPAASTPESSPAAPQGTTNTTPLPNPWASGGSQPPRTTGGTAGATNSPSTTTASGTAGGGGTAGASSPFQGNPALMQQMMQNQLQNPQAMVQMMQNPAVQAMMDSFLSDPQRMEQMIAANPMFAGNPQMVSLLNTQFGV